MNQKLSGITLGQINVFLHVVEMESFTKAAINLHMTQSAVSKIIAKIERELELTLFTRHYRELQVTENGRELYALWKPRLEQISGSYEALYAKQREENTALRIGTTNTTDLKLYFWEIVNEYQNRYSEVNLEFNSDSMERLIQKLADGKLDLIFVPDFMKYRLEEGGFSWVWAARDHVQIVLPKSHPLAEKEKMLELSDIKDMTFVILTDSEYPENERYIEELFLQAGFDLKIEKKRYPTPESIQDFYRQEDGFMITDSYFKFDGDREHMIRKPIKGFFNGIICGWNQNQRHKGRDLFLKIFM
ncbi:hypothetical protein CXIVA_10470 [Clostridium sp. SY8519]|uniref:LysR family transcriptional regulator n=1 Tax=Clostridium sp. (strain SY8519) TaxID=1042156 RepID=UPI0002171B45|nr:LysR family transcriptional regulator [Clostridium sp. SY8519]BAK47014.1 hypothetical protein CXIVA_10470 [Clostridium sp. SY8519]